MIQLSTTLTLIPIGHPYPAFQLGVTKKGGYADQEILRQGYHFRLVIA